MVKVKICGLTRAEDVEFAVESGADYTGFILYPKSPRFVEPSKVKDLLRAGEGSLRVAVVVNPSEEEILRILDLGFDLVQLHGEEDPKLLSVVEPKRVIKAFRVKDSPPKGLRDWSGVHGILLDTYSKMSYGGTGEVFDWSVAKEVVKGGFKVFLAGGLRPENVRRAVCEVRPYCVDVSSGVEISPGIKDKMKVREFIREAKGL